MRAKIAIRNLLVSESIILLFLLYAYFTWFPHSFEKLGGFTETAQMLIFVDLVLGPLLVFIVFKEGKKYLQFDINVLLGIQIAAFVFGAYSLFLKHPAYAVFSGDRFTLINVSHIYPQQTLLNQIQHSFFSTPKFVVAKLPDDAKKQSSLILDIVLKKAPDIDRRLEFYKPMEQFQKTVLSKSIPIEQLSLNKKTKVKVTEFIEENGGIANDYAFFPLKGNTKKDVIWVFDRDTVKPVGIIDADPWSQTNQYTLKQ